MRIAVGGFEHETNTFAPVGAGFAEFEQPDAWPGLSRGDALFGAVAGINLPVTGFVERAQLAGAELVPLSWCSAVPSAEVTEDAFERIAALLLEDLAAAGALDGVYLDLHGAMVCDHLEDGEGELLRRVRAVIGPDLPLVVSLDLHANVTAAMVGFASALVAFRTYPHIDMAETGARAADELLRQIEQRTRPVAFFTKPPFLVPVQWGCTGIEPARGLYGRLAEIEREAAVLLSFTQGFPLADIAECGPAVLAYGDDPVAVEAAGRRLTDAVNAHEGDYAGRLWSPDEAVAAARAHTGPRPVVLADTQDNPGGGGNSDTVGLLESLVRNEAEGAVVAILFDPEAAAAAHGAGEGAVLSCGIGARSAYRGEKPFVGEFRVETLTDGRFDMTGPMWRGSRADLGPMALLRVVAPGDGGVLVIVASRKLQAADRSIFRHMGIEPEAMRILALKSSVHFRADFEPIADDILVVEAPGPCIADVGKLEYRRLRAGVRTVPLGPPHRN